MIAASPHQKCPAARLLCAGLQALHVRRYGLRKLPAAALRQATGLTSLCLCGNSTLQADSRELLQLLDALPRLRELNLLGTRAATSPELEAAAQARGLALQMPGEEDVWSSADEEDFASGYDSSESETSDDGCPRYSWAGCAYASRWAGVGRRMQGWVHGWKGRQCACAALKLQLS